MLYSRRIHGWKIADFGRTTPGCSEGEEVTTNAHGTSGYRAPELILPSPSHEKYNYTNKVDIWALGCILYEVVVRRKAFESDWSVMEYARYNPDIRKFLSSLESETTLSKDSQQYIQNAVKNMLEVEASKRPSAKTFTHSSSFSTFGELKKLGNGFSLRLGSARCNRIGFGATNAKG